MSRLLINKNLIPVIILAVLSLIWGSSFILIKRGLDAFSPLEVGALRLTIAFLTLLPIAVKYFNKHYRNNWKKYLLLGTVANLIPSSLFPLAETHLASSIAGILNSLTPIFTLIVGAIFFGTRIRKLQSIGLFVGLIGSVLLIIINNAGNIGGFNFYALLVIAATICYGFSSNMIKKFFPETNTVILTSLTMFSVGPVSIIYLITQNTFAKIFSSTAALTSLGYIFILATFGTAFALIFFNRLIQITSAVFASTVTYLIPVMALVWGNFDGENIYSLHLVSMAIILIGVFIVNKQKYISGSR